MDAPKLTAERLRELLHYDLQTGVFTWKVSSGRAVVGDLAGRLTKTGHRYIGVNGQLHLASRLAWLYTRGEWPTGRLRHINHTPDDVRIANLCLIERADGEAPLTADKLRKLLHYNPETGVFTRLVRDGKWLPGQVAGSAQASHGYVAIGVAGKPRLAHRLAWLYVYGEWPDGVIDHINRDRTDNRIVNLRSVSQAENGQNAKLSCRNKSGHKGVIWYRRDQVWRAYIVVNQVSIHLGYYPHIDDAVAARRAAEAKYHPCAPKESQDA
jgi:hypothetical protein